MKRKNGLKRPIGIQFRILKFRWRRQFQARRRRSVGVRTLCFPPPPPAPPFWTAAAPICSTQFSKITAKHTAECAVVTNLRQSLSHPRPLHLHHPCPMPHEEAKGLCLHHRHRVGVMRLFSIRLYRPPHHRLRRRRWGACWPEQDLRAF